MNPVLKKNFAVFTVLDWIATLTAHIPDKGEQLIRYYGYYSNVPRGKRKKEKPEDKNEIREVDALPLSRELKKRWSDLFWISDYGTKRKRTGFDVSDAFVSP
jgi:Putative transposase